MGGLHRFSPRHRGTTRCTNRHRWLIGSIVAVRIYIGIRSGVRIDIGPGHGISIRIGLDITAGECMQYPHTEQGQQDTGYHRLVSLEAMCSQVAITFFWLPGPCYEESRLLLPGIVRIATSFVCVCMHMLHILLYEIVLWCC